MASGMTKLVDTLTAREAGLAEMRQLLEEERESMLAFDTERLQAAAARKVELAGRMEELDSACRTLLNQEGAGTVSALLSRGASPEGGQLATLQARLTGLAEEVRGMMADNRRLLESSLAMIGRSLAFFQSRFTVAETYGHSGQMVERAGSGLLRKEL